LSAATSPEHWRFARWLAVLTVAAAILRTASLAGQPPLGDDLSAGASAVNFVERSQIGPTMWQHPRVRDLLVYASLAAAGHSKLGLVLPSLLLGILAIPVVGLLGRRLAGDRAGLLAAFLLAVDPVHVGFSREGIQEVYTALFGAAGVLATLRHLDTRRATWAIVAGMLFGLGLASKWSVAFPLAISLGWACWSVAREVDVGPALRRARLALLASTLVLLPAATYLATWAPWFGGGRGLGDWVVLQLAMAAEATHHAGFNPADAEMPHRAFLWFLWPGHYASSAFGPDGPLPFVAISNPLTWLATLPAIAWLAREAWRTGTAERGLLPALVLATWLPFAVASRPIWLHSALAVLPFALAAVAAAAVGVTERAPAGRRWLAAYVIAAAVMAAPLYLLATGLAMDVPALRGAALSYRPASTLGPGSRP
jgi:dolichyl-phosphate-mannose-protein mannosyltransferase